MILSDALILP